MMGGTRHLSWALFQQLIEEGAPAVEPVAGEVDVEIFTEAGGGRIGIRTPAPDVDLPLSPLVEIDISSRVIRGEARIEISTANRGLYRDFYAFACAVADRVQLDNLDIETAISSALESWADLLRQVTLLSDEKELGLFGELWALRTCAASFGWRVAVRSWKGPQREEHDISLENTDIEVKATNSERRVHTISSLTQLVPAGDRPLVILSVQLTSGGAAAGALTLSDLVAETTTALRGQPHQVRDRFTEGLAAAGWNPAHADHYRRKLSLRTPICLIPVDERCPAITPPLLDPLGSDRSARIRDVSYRVDLTGLGHEDGSAEFAAVFPSKEE